MALARYEGVAQDSAGNVISNATVEVRRDQAGRPVVPLFSDRNGTVPLGNPITTNERGQFGFHVPGGTYYIRVFTGPSQAPFQEYTRRYQAVGTAAERDVEELASSLNSGMGIFATGAALDLFTPDADNVGARVINDPDPALNGDYLYIADAWVKQRALPDTLARMEVTGGTADAIEASLTAGVDPAAVVMMLLTPETPNTGPVTINGIDLVAFDGSPLEEGWLEAGVPVFLFVNGDGDYQLTSDVRYTLLAAEIATTKIETLAACDKAEEWADNPEDDAVETGQFSAKHHAIKSAASSGASAASAGSSAAAAATSVAASVVSIAAKDAAVAASEAAGVDHWEDTKADATAGLGGYAEGDVIGVFADESNAGAQVFYRVEGGVLVEKVDIDDRTKSVVRQTFGYVTPQMYGAVGDGIADDADALEDFFDAVQGHVGVLGPYTYYTARRIATPLVNVSLVGIQGLTKITSDYATGTFDEQLGFIKLEGVDNASILGVTFESTAVSAELDTGSALLFSYQDDVRNLSVRNCKFTAPDGNTTGFSVFARTDLTDTSGEIDGLWVEDNEFIDIGGAACSVMNRSTDKSAAQRFYFRRNKGRNLGLGGDYGFMLTMDGVGRDFEVSQNSVYNALGIGIENTGWCDGEFANNTFDGFSRVYAPMSFSSGAHASHTDMTGLRIVGNRTITPANSRSNFIGVSSSHFADNYFEANAEGAFNMRDAVGNKFIRDTYKSNGLYAAMIGATGNDTTDNEWNACIFDNSASAANNSTITFSGAGTLRNRVISPSLRKGAAGFVASNVSGASGNFVEGYRLAGAATDDDYINITLSDADYSLSNANAVLRKKVYRFTGTLTANRTVTFPDGSSDFFVWNDTDFQLTITTVSGNGHIVYPRSRSAYFYADAANLRSLNAFGSAWNTGQGLLGLGTYKLWVDSSGRLRIKQGVPTSETDGTVIGAQT